MKFLPNRFAAILDGYLDGSGEMLRKEELNALPMAPIVITYELGVAFLLIFSRVMCILRLLGRIIINIAPELNLHWFNRCLIPLMR